MNASFSTDLASAVTPLPSATTAPIAKSQAAAVAQTALVLSSTPEEARSDLATRAKSLPCAADAALEPSRPGAGVFFSPTDARFLERLSAETIKKGEKALEDIVPAAKEKAKIRWVPAGHVVGLSPMLVREIFSYIPAKGCQVAKQFNENEKLDSARRQQFFDYVINPKSDRFTDLFKSDYGIFESKILRNRDLKNGGLDVNYHMLFETFINKNPEENTWLLHGLLFKCARKNYTDIVLALLNRPEFSNPLSIGIVLARFEEHHHLESIQRLIDEHIINEDNIDNILNECFKRGSISAINFLLRAFPDPEQERINRMVFLSLEHNRIHDFTKILDAQREYALTPELIWIVACKHEFLLYALTHTRITDDQIKDLLQNFLDTPQIYRDNALKNFKTLLKTVDLTVEERDFLLENCPADFGQAIDAVIASGPTTEAVRQLALTRKVAHERSCCCLAFFRN
jgi:hypothetical protein